MVRSLIILVLMPAYAFGATFITNASALESEISTTTESVTLMDTTTFQTDEVVRENEEEGMGKQVALPCKCAGGTCSCCTGQILENFNFNTRQKLCSHLTYDADDTSLGIKLAWNDRVLYQNRISGKNPPPVCVPIPPTRNVRACLRFNNVYLIGRNIHACLTVEAQYNKGTMFEMNFDCIRLGTSGVSLVKPEEGGGLPIPISNEPDDIEDYDESVATTDKPPKKPVANVIEI